MRRRTTLIGAMLIKNGEADGMVCGTVSSTAAHLRYIDRVLGCSNTVYAAMNGLVLPGRQIFWSTRTSTSIRAPVNWPRSR